MTFMEVAILFYFPIQRSIADRVSLFMCGPLSLVGGLPFKAPRFASAMMSLR